MSSTTISSTSFSLKIFTAFIGSPTYLCSLNFTDFTSPPFCNSKTGITLTRFINSTLQNSPIASFQLCGSFQDGIERPEYSHAPFPQQTNIHNLPSPKHLHH